MGVPLFDSLKFARRLTEVGVPERQAERQAELMSEYFNHSLEQLVTRDYLSQEFDRRFVQQDAKYEKRLDILTWMLGLLIVVEVVPKLQLWLG